MNMPIAPAAAGTTVNPMTAGASPAAASPLGGFEALLAALFGGEGQVASPLMKTVQPTEGDASAQGATDQDAPLGADTSAAQSLLAAFAMAPAPAAPLVVQPTPQGEAEGPASAAGQTVQPLAAQTVPGMTVPEPAVPGEAAAAAEAVPGQAAATPTDLNEALPASTPALANAPGQAPAGPTQPAATTPPAPAVATQDPLPDPALQSAKSDPAAAPPSPPAPQAPAASQAPQLAAAAHVPAQKPADAPAKTADAQSPTATAAAEGEIEPDPAAASGAAAAKPSAATEPTPGLRKNERADAAVQPPAPQADAAPQPTHAHAPAETTTTSGTAASAHAPATHAAGVRGAPETVATLAAEILKKLDSRTTRFDMELQPHGLGKVDVRLEIGAHGRLTAAMAFENPQSAQELKNRSGELVRALEQAGFDVTDGLSFDVADNSYGSGQSSGNSAQDQTQDAPWRGRAFLAALETAGAADAPPIATMNLARLRASGVDIKI